MLPLHHTTDFQWLATFPYLADVFSVLNALNLALQGKTVTVLNTVAAFKEHLQGLDSGKKDTELDTGFVTLDSLVDIVFDGTLKMTFREKSLPDYWVQIQHWHSELADTALKRLMPFPTTYNCDIGFSSLVGLKVRQCNRINVESDLRIKLSSLEPDIFFTDVSAQTAPRSELVSKQ